MNINTKDVKTNPFNQFKFIKHINISRFYNKNVSNINKLSKELVKLSHINDNDKKLDKEFLFRIKNKSNEYSSISCKNLNKSKLVKKDIKSLNKFKKENILLDEKQLFSLRKKYNTKNKNNKIYNSKGNVSNNNLKNLTLYNKNNFKNIILEYRKISNNLTRKNIKKIKIFKNNSLNDLISNNYSKPKSLKNYFIKYDINSNSSDKNNISKNETNYLSINIDNISKNNKDSQTFITQQKSEIKNKNHKNLFKKISNIKLSNFINTSSDLYKKNFIKLTTTNKTLLSGRKKFYNIKYLLEKFENSKNIKKHFDYYINEDIDIENIYNSMLLYHNSLKNKITINKNELNKVLMITKKNADIINYSDYYCNMEDLYFYKNNKIYRENYPKLSKKALIDPLVKDYKKFVYHSQKNIIKSNDKYIREIAKSFRERIERIK